MAGQHRSGDTKWAWTEHEWGWRVGNGGVHRRRRDDHDSPHRRGFRRVRVIQSLLVYGLLAVLSLAGSTRWEYQANSVGGSSGIIHRHPYRVGGVQADRAYAPANSSDSDLRAIRGRVRVHDRPSGDGGVAERVAAVVPTRTARSVTTTPPPAHTHYTCSELEQLWISQGGNPSAAFTAAEVAMAESGGNASAISPTDDVGLWQVNRPSWGASASTDPVVNARAAIAISHNGTNWTPWTTYTSGAYAGRC